METFTYMIFITHYIECPMTFLDVILLWNIGQCILAAIRAPPFLKCIKTKHCFLWNNGMCYSSNNVFLDVATGIWKASGLLMWTVSYIFTVHKILVTAYIYIYTLLSSHSKYKFSHLPFARCTFDRVINMYIHLLLVSWITWIECTSKVPSRSCLHLITELDALDFRSGYSEMGKDGK